MLEARLNPLRDWGYNLGNGVFVARFRAYREDHGVRLNAPKRSANKAGLRSCPRIIHVNGYSHQYRLRIDECIKIRLPAEMGSLILDGEDRADFWAYVRARDNMVEVYECSNPQRRLPDLMSAFIPFGQVMGSRSPNYRRGQRFCPNCMIAFYTNLERRPYCGCILRSSPRGGKSRNAQKKYVDPGKYGVMAKSVGRHDVEDRARGPDQWRE